MEDRQVEMNKKEWQGKKRILKMRIIRGTCSITSSTQTSMVWGSQEGKRERNRNFISKKKKGGGENLPNPRKETDIQV